MTKYLSLKCTYDIHTLMLDSATGVPVDRLSADYLKSTYDIHTLMLDSATGVPVDRLSADYL